MSGRLSAMARSSVVLNAQETEIPTALPERLSERLALSVPVRKLERLDLPAAASRLRLLLRHRGRHLGKVDLDRPAGLDWSPLANRWLREEALPRLLPRYLRRWAWRDPRLALRLLRLLGQPSARRYLWHLLHVPPRDLERRVCGLPSRSPPDQYWASPSRRGTARRSGPSGTVRGGRACSPRRIPGATAAATSRPSTNTPSHSSRRAGSAGPSNWPVPKATSRSSSRHASSSSSRPISRRRPWREPPSVVRAWTMSASSSSTCVAIRCRRDST